MRKRMIGLFLSCSTSAVIAAGGFHGGGPCAPGTGQTQCKTVAAKPGFSKPVAIAPQVSGPDKSGSTSQKLVVCEKGKLPGAVMSQTPCKTGK